MPLIMSLAWPFFWWCLKSAVPNLHNKDIKAFHMFWFIDLSLWLGVTEQKLNFYGTKHADFEAAIQQQVIVQLAKDLKTKLGTFHKVTPCESLLG